MKRSYFNSVSGLALFLVPIFSVAGSGGDRVEMKGYYGEDGTVLRQRVMDALSPGDALPALPTNLRERKESIADYYQGRLAAVKVSFPACRQGVLLDLDRLGRTNIDLYRRIDHCGAAMEKDEKSIITRFRTTKSGIDVDLNGGGYGTAGDVAWRAAGDVLTLGLLELRDDTQKRKRRGSRLRVVFGNKGSSLFSAADINVEKFQATLSSGERPSDKLLKTALGPVPEGPGFAAAARIAGALNHVQLMPDLDRALEAEKLALPRWAVKRLAKTRKVDQERALAENLEALLSARESGRKFDIDTSALPPWANKVLLKKSKTKQMKNALPPEPSFENLSKKQRRKMLNRARRESLPPKPWPEKKRRELNREILRALYPSEIIRGRRVWTSDNLNIETINAYLSPAVGL